MKNIILKISLAFVVFFVGNFKIVYSNEMKSNNINTRVISEFYNYVEEKIEDDGNEKIRFANTSTLIYPTWSCTGDKYEKLDNIFTLRNSKVDAIHYLKPLTVSQLNSIEVFMNKYPNVIELSEPTKNYNCHSYAFYSQDVNNNIAWISNPTIYYSDYSYDEITNYTEIKKGDIICYFDKNNVNKHSAIVERIDGIIMNNTVEYMSNLVVSSKWGEFGLYQHKGDYCPYVKESNANFKNFRCFRPHQHKFIYNQILEDSHFGLCSICGDPTTNGEHHFEFNF